LTAGGPFRREPFGVHNESQDLKMSTSFAIPNSEASILSRLLDLHVVNLTPAAAEFLLTIRFPQADIARMNHLSQLAQQGVLSGDQQVELDSYIHVSNLLALMQSRARQLLRSQSSI
jgi:hypothetical protein